MKLEYEFDDGLVHLTIRDRRGWYRETHDLDTVIYHTREILDAMRKKFKVLRENPKWPD